MVNLYLHIGLIKTGTTFFQHQVFPRLNGIVYIGGKNGIHSRYLIDYNPKYLISNEGMSGNPYNRNKNIGYFDQFKLSIDNIIAIHPSVKIICCFREPSSFIESTYKQYLHEGGTLKFEQFFSIEKSGSVHSEDLFFSKYVNYILSKFDSKDVFVYTFDEFLQNRVKLVDDIITFLECSTTIESLDINVRAKSNPSVMTMLESCMINLNKLNAKFQRTFGVPMQIKLFGKILNIRVFVQYLLPKILHSFKFNDTKRDLSSIREFYIEDWRLCVSIIKGMRNV